MFLSKVYNLAFVLLVVAGSIIPTFAHRNCGFRDRTNDEADHELRIMQNTLARRNINGNARIASNKTIGVYFHIIQNTKGKGAVSDDVLAEQIDILNAAFAEGEWNFVLKETDVTVNNDWYQMDADSAEEAEAKRSLRKGTGSDLNFYTARPLDNTLGWATFPQDYENDAYLDGVVCDFGTLPGGDVNPYNEGDTGTHEVGHWMGLYHTFQGGCGGSGDFVDDTPAVKDPNFGCPTIDSCPADGQGLDMTWNFMDYTDDNCMDTFTDGQISRMNDMWNAYRVDSSCQVNCKDPSASSYQLSGTGVLIVAVVIVVVLAIFLGGAVGYLLWAPGHAAKVAPMMEPSPVEVGASIEDPPVIAEPCQRPSAVERRYHEISLEPM